MYAVIRTGGKQHRVVTGDRIKVEKLTGEVGSELTLDDVLLVGNGEDIKVGQPVVEGAAVKVTIIAQDRGPKVIAFKRKRRKGYHKKIGHRQPYTELEVRDIQG